MYLYSRVDYHILSRSLIATRWLDLSRSPRTIRC
nr:MAG TPA: hypothetical protein [Caudoviricetes sp.]